MPSTEIVLKRVQTQLCTIEPPTTQQLPLKSLLNFGEVVSLHGLTGVLGSDVLG